MTVNRIILSNVSLTLTLISLLGRSRAIGYCTITVSLLSSPWRSSMSATDTDPNDSRQPTRAKWEIELEEILAASDREPSSVDKARGKVVAARYQAPEQVRLTTSR